jgi:flavin reductase (DIM6/NTAB) family NADH-FMN oxidoreductase RutF
MLFYEPRARDRSILPHDPFKALIAPRPIGWVTTQGRDGSVNLAPYSFFNAFADRPPIIAFSSAGYKDSVTYAEETGEFVWNMPTYSLRDSMNKTAAPLPLGQSEADYAGLEMAPSRLVSPPHVKDSPAVLECKLIEVKRLADRHGTALDYWLVIGEVVGVHIDARFIRNGIVDMAAMQPIARCGYKDYVVADRVFEMDRPPGTPPG